MPAAADFFVLRWPGQPRAATKQRSYLGFVLAPPFLFGRQSPIARGTETRNPTKISDAPLSIL